MVDKLEEELIYLIYRNEENNITDIQKVDGKKYSEEIDERIDNYNKKESNKNKIVEKITDKKIIEYFKYLKVGEVPDENSRINELENVISEIQELIRYI